MVKPVSLNERLQLVIPIYADDSDTIAAYIHSAPISRETFEAHYALVARTFSAIYADTLGAVAGPRIASLVLNKVAAESGDTLGAMALLNEIRRLTNVVSRGSHGWVTEQFQDALDHKSLNEDDLAEVTNAIVFFTVASAIYPRRMLRPMMDSVMPVWGARITFSNFTAFIASLGTSTADASTQKTLAPGSSVAY